MEWIKFNKKDHDTYPEWSGNWDHTSKTVLVKYKRPHPFKDRIELSLGYTDFDGDNEYWNLIPYNHPDGNGFEIIEWSYIK